MEKYYYLNFGDLSEEAQEEIMESAKKDLEKNEEELRKEAKDMNIDYETLLGERAERHLYSYNFVFNI